MCGYHGAKIEYYSAKNYSGLILRDKSKTYLIIVKNSQLLTLLTFCRLTIRKLVKQKLYQYSRW